MTDYTRVTVLGAARKAELVVPNDIAMAGLLPDLLEMLEERGGSASRPLSLVRTTGEQVDLALSASDQGLDDGAILRLVRQEEAPPPPEIADVTDVLAERRATRGLWSRDWLHATAAVGVGVLGLIGGLGVSALDTALSLPLLGGLLGALVAVAVVAGRFRGRWVALAATAVALGLTPATAGVAIEAMDAATAPTLAGAVAVLLAWLVLFLGIGVGLGDRPALWGSLLGIGLAALAGALAVTPWAPTGIAGVVATVAVVACGVLPWYALSLSGLTGLDDEVVEGRPRRRETVLVTVDAAYRTLSWSVAAVAVAIAGSGAVLLSSGDPWAVGLGAAAIVVTALRTRAVPLTVQVVLLWGAVLVAVSAALASSPLLEDWGRGAVALALAAGCAVAAGLRPPEHQRASLRRFGNAIETVAVVAILPLLLGVHGVYADLLEAF